MSITDLTALIQDAGKKRDHSQRLELLKKAHVLNAQGEMDSRFFSSEEKSAKPSK